MLFSILVTGADGRWIPGIGDPSVIGWVTVVAYAFAAYLSWTAARAGFSRARALDGAAPAEAGNQLVLGRLWLGVAIIMVLLGLNKQLDLQTFFTQVMRDLAISQGWYEERRKYQLAFIGAVMLGGVMSTAGAAFALRRVMRRALGALVGLSLIVSFVVIRAVSFHHVDLLLSQGGPVRLNWVLELGGIAVLGAAAYRAARGDSSP